MGGTIFMINKVLTVSEHLYHDSLVEIQSNISDKGLPVFELSGLVSKSVEESKKRVVIAFENSGFTFPLKNIIVNISPANLTKTGTHYDLGIAVSILKPQIQGFKENSVFIGELSFDGSVKPVHNLFYLIISAIERGVKHIYIPSSSNIYLPKINDINIYPLDNLNSLTSLDSILPISSGNYNEVVLDTGSNYYQNIVGNYNEKRAIAYCLIGNHSIIIQGPPGVGKSILVKGMRELAPKLEEEEYIKVSKLYSYSGIQRDSNDFSVPFRSPHPLSSYASVFGSFNSRLNVGEITLANKGILFLDEFPEFNRQVIEGLRIPMEEKYVQLSRSGIKTNLESDFIFAATANPCKCGYFNHPKISCTCSPLDIKRYQTRISGPIEDRIDINLRVSENNVNFFNEKNNYPILEYPSLRKIVSEKKLQRKLILNPDNSGNLTVNQMFNIIVQKHISFKILNFINNELKLLSISERVKIKLINLFFSICLFNNRDTIQIDDVMEGLSLKVRKL